MNWDRIKGRWREATDQIKSLWGKAIDDDAMSLAGKRQELVGSLQGRVDGAVPSQPKVETTP